MFKQKFTDEMQKIKPSEQSLAQLLEKIKNEQEKTEVIPFKKPTKKRWIAAVAAVLAVVIVSVTAFNLPIFKIPLASDGEVDFPVIEHQKGIPANVSYNQIFSLFSAIYKSEQNRYKYSLTDADGMEFIEEETVINEDAVEGVYDDATGTLKGSTAGTNGENTTAKPDSANDLNQSATEQENEDFSATNTQVEGVDEADIVKTDGKYIYTLSTKNLKIEVTKAEKGVLKSVSSIDLSENSNTNKKYYYSSEMYVTGGRLVVLYQSYDEKTFSLARIYDVTNPEKPELIRKVSQSGSYLSSRVIGNKLYYFTNEYLYTEPQEDNRCSYVPCASVDDDAPAPIEEKNIYMFDGEINRSYLTAISVDLTTGSIVDTKTALGGGSQLYANTKSIYVTAEKSSYSYAADTGTSDLATKYEHLTRIMRFSLDSGKITAVAEGTVEGSPLNQFSMDEYGGYFRIVTTKNDDFSTVNGVYIFDKSLNQVGKIENIAKGEQVYSVRFMGDTGYFVTFRQTDPLFAVDLKDPKNPKILSALKIPGFSNYMHPWAEGLLLGIGADADEKTGVAGGAKLSMFDISNPADVTEKHKTVMDIHNLSDLGTNHKSILVNQNKNLIGFATNDKEYYLFGYDKESGFAKKAALAIPTNESTLSNYGRYYYSQNTRGIFIGDYFYVCSVDGIISYKLSDFSKVDSLIF